MCPCQRAMNGSGGVTSGHSSASTHTHTKQACHCEPTHSHPTGPQPPTPPCHLSEAHLTFPATPSATLMTCAGSPLPCCASEGIKMPQGVHHPALAVCVCVSIAHACTTQPQHSDTAGSTRRLFTVGAAATQHEGRPLWQGGHSVGDGCRNSTIPCRLQTHHDGRSPLLTLGIDAHVAQHAGASGTPPEPSAGRACGRCAVSGPESNPHAAQPRLVSRA